MSTSRPLAPAVTRERNGGASRAISWRAAFILSFGGALLVTVSLGPMAAEIGAASLLIWG